MSKGKLHRLISIVFCEHIYIIKILILTLLDFYVVIYLDKKISLYDLDYYHGKDNGFISRLEWACLISSIFFLIMTKRKRILSMFLGLLIGFISIIFCSFLISEYTILSPVWGQFLASILYILTFFLTIYRIKYFNSK